MTDFGDVAATVRERVTPTAAERDELEAAIDALLRRTRAAVDDLPVEGDVRLVGSTARNTWISGDRDIDIFVLLPPSLSRDALESHGLSVGHAVLPDGREEFAEHPYVHGTYDGFEVDLVPCYAVESATEIESAVDRTPFHTAYLEERLTDDIVGEVRVFKQFLKGIGVYGSDLHTRGFSGYLTELLVLEYGSAAATLKAAADWHPPVELDPADHGSHSFDAPLIVVDPTDPIRNVAAVVAAENVARFQHHARSVLAEPAVEAFFPREIEPLGADAVRDYIADRATVPVAVVFESPDLVADELYPQLRKSLAGIGDALERRGFECLRRTTFADDRALFLFELAVVSRPRIERHDGPPVHVRTHAERFLETYTDADVYGPFIEGDRYVVERDRTFTSAVDFLRSEAVLETRLGPRVETALRSDYSVLEGEAIATLVPAFGREFARYFEPRP